MMMKRSILEWYMVVVLMIILCQYFLLIIIGCSCSSSSNVDDSTGTLALYVFGDSTVDSGNNNFLPTIAKADYLPYGLNFPNGTTGRFTNGRTVADFIAEFLGLPYPPPYLSLRDSGILTGLNYASGACGILPQTGTECGKCLSLSEQVDMFERTVKSDLPKHLNSSQLWHHLSTSIFLFSIGSNDYINNYLDLTTSFSSSTKQQQHYSPPQFAQLLIGALSQQLQRMQSLGARKMVVFEIGPIGCIPSIAKTREHVGLCDEDVNLLASYFNHLLPPMLSNLTHDSLLLHQHHPSSFSTFVLGHANWLGYDAIINPSKYGLMDSSTPCCTTWGNGTSGCIPLMTPCSTWKDRYFWDAFHLTETIYSIIATRCFNDSTLCIPISIRDLANYNNNSDHVPTLV